MKKEFGYVTDREGNAVAGASVYVRKQADSSLLTLYSDNGITSTSNPLTTDNDGEYSFYTTDNVIKVQTFVDGVQQQEVNQVQHYDLSIISAAAWTILDDATVGDIRATLGVGTGDSPQFTAVNIGAATDTTVSRASAGDIAVEGNLIYRAGGTDVPITDGGTGSSTAGGALTNLGVSAFAQTILDDANAAAVRTTIGLGTIATFDETTAAQYRANTSGKALSTDKVWAAADYVALTDQATIAMDMSAGFNFSVTLAGNRTLDAPTNTKNGQTGAIVITQDGTGSRTLAYHANWKFAGGTDPVLSTTAASVDILFYQVISATSIYGTLVKAVA